MWELFVILGWLMLLQRPGFAECACEPWDSHSSPDKLKIPILNWKCVI